MRARLLPAAALVTPNLDEAEVLTGLSVRSEADMRAAAHALCDLGARAALVKGGHLEGPMIDVLLVDGEEHLLRGTRVAGGPWHGTGCTFSAAIVANLAEGASMVDAVLAARGFVFDAIRHAAQLGRGAFLLDHAAAGAALPRTRHDGTR
jgi:hydroxymethylpyrimidine/phosphomethylpyrimidine kinase